MASWPLKDSTQGVIGEVGFGNLDLVGKRGLGLIPRDSGDGEIAWVIDQSLHDWDADT